VTGRDATSTVTRDAATALRPNAAGLLERNAELEAIEQLVADARAGSGRRLVIEARAGMGKTRLLTEARRIAEEQGALVLTARGAELEHDFAFGVVRQLFEPLVAQASPERRSELLAGAASFAAPLVDPAAADPAAGSSSEFSLLHGLYWLVSNAAVEQPLVLVVDDLHWTDPHSLRFLGYLAGRLDDLPLLLVGGTRPTRQALDPQLLAALLAVPDTTLLQLDPLSGEAAAALLADVLVATPTQSFVDACVASTGGNPLLLRELAAALREQAVTPTDDAVAQVAQVGSHAVARSTSLRLARLPDAATALAQAVAVLGDGAELAHAAQVAGLDTSAASPLVAALADADVLAPTSPLEFTHAIIRDAVLNMLGPGEREEAHGRAAAVLRDAGASAERIAAQLLLTHAAGDPDSIATLREAARAAVRRGAPDSATRYLQRAVDGMPSGSDRADLVAELGMTAATVDSDVALPMLRETVDTLEDPLRRREAALLLARMLYVNHDQAGGAALLADSEHWPETPASAPMARRILGSRLLVLMATPRSLDQAQQLAARLRTLEPIGEVRADGLVSIAIAAADAQYGGGSREDVVARVRQVNASGWLTGDDPWSWNEYLLIGADELDDVDALHEVGGAVSRERGLLFGLAGVATGRAQVSLLRGDLASAEEHAREAVAIQEETGFRTIMPFALAWLAESLALQGRLDDAMVALEPIASLPADGTMMDALGARGRVKLLGHKPQSALADFEAVRAISDDLGIRNPALSGTDLDAAIAHLHLGDADTAIALVDSALPGIRAWGAPRMLGRALRVSALARGGEDAEALLTESIEVLSGTPFAIELASSQFQLGSLRRRDNRRVEARPELEAALAAFTRSGATLLADLAREELLATGARPRRNEVSGPASLTASERRVARMAADGMTNREIAQALYVTAKTVEVHLSATYRKLGIKSRLQLAGALGADS
jgi:DNA-binding CsgD family transcriptional regulator